MYRDYTKVIKESPNELRDLEKKHRNTLIASRMRLLHVLKSGEARTLSQASEVIQYSRMQCHRWLKTYQQQGLKALLQDKQKPPGSAERMTQEAWEKLNKALEQGEIGSYKQARALLAQEGVVYKDDSSVFRLFKRHQIKAKLGRPVHEKADVEKQEAFKKTSATT